MIGRPPGSPSFPSPPLSRSGHGPPPPRFRVVLLAAVLPVAAPRKPAAKPSDKPKMPEIKYPDARQCDQTDDYHDTQVPDPYRWLEDPDSEETRSWIEAENKLTFGYLEAIPQRDAIRERLTKLWDFEKFGTPSVHGGTYFYSRNDGLQNQNVLYW